MAAARELAAWFSGPTKRSRDGKVCPILGLQPLQPSVHDAGTVSLKGGEPLLFVIDHDRGTTGQSLWPKPAGLQLWNVSARWKSRYDILLSHY